MEMSFNFQANPRLYFGNGKLFLLPNILSDFGSNVLLITTNSFIKTLLYSKLQEEFGKFKYKVVEYVNSGEPSTESVDNIVKEFSKENINVVVSIGGGSAIDLGKAVSAMLPLRESVIEYLEGVGSKKPEGYKVPFIAIPTTAGTGAEATKNAVISKIGDKGFKKSLRHDNFMPDVAIVDPVLTKNCPKEIAFTSGMDALTQLIESYVSTASNVYTDALCEKAFSLFGMSFEKIVSGKGEDIDYSNLSFAAYVSGLTLTNAGLGVVHGFASVIGGYYVIPHGVVCAKLLLPSTKKIVENIVSHEYLEKYNKASIILSSGKFDNILDYLNYLAKLQELPSFMDFGIKKKDFLKIASESSIKNSPAKLNKDHLIEILEEEV